VCGHRSCRAWSLDFSSVPFSLQLYDTLALHALVDDTIEKTTAVVTEGGAVVGVLLELVLRPRVLRYYTITPCTHTRGPSLGPRNDDNGDADGDGDGGGDRDPGDARETAGDEDRWISRSLPVSRGIVRAGATTLRTWKRRRKEDFRKQLTMFPRSVERRCGDFGL